MSLFWVAVTVTVVSVGYSLHMAQKARKAAERARREAEQKAELQKGFQFTEEGEAKAIPIMYGRGKIGGVRVHFKVTDSYAFANIAGGGTVFESMKQPDNATPIVYRLVNSNANWTGSWSYVPSSIAEFASNPGWIVTKDEINVWKLPNRAFEGETLIYTAPAVDFVFCSFKNGTDTSTKPSAALQALGFQFPVRTNTVPVLDKNVSGEKNEFYFIQQAICQSGIANIYTVDVDQKPYTYDAYSYGLRIHAYKNGSVADPLMIANDSTRTNARFTNVAYATCAFKLNRDDPQYNGTPEVQFYAEGNLVKEILKNSNNYSLSNYKVYSNNSALVLLDYLTNTLYGKGVAESDIDLESFYKAAKICSIQVKSNVANKGKLNLAKAGTKNIYLYECNLILDSATSSRDNIQKILDTMAMSSLVWTEGKYRLNLPYAYVFTTGLTYQIDDVVQITDNNNKNRLFRAINTTVQNPLINAADWVEDAIPSDVIDINDNDLVRDTEVLVSWPDASTKLNFATVRFLNEEKDFSEDTINWPEKEPTDGTAIYQTFLTEDNGIQLETESFEDGCVTPYHALARAEQKVRASRGVIVYNFKAVARVFTLEPGDLFGFSSELFKIPYTILKVDEIETEEGGVVKVTGSTFDARLLAWNVPDNFYAPLPDNFEGYSLKQAKNLRMVLGESNNRTSNYRLEWDSAGDNRVSRYIVKYTSDSINNITSTTVWTEIITTSTLSCELPALDGNYTFAVVSMAANGRQAPFRNLIEGSAWPLINYTMSSAFLEGFDSLNVVLSNDVHSLLSNADGLVASQSYAGSGTSVKVYSGSTALVYDGVGVTPGTWKVTAPAGNQVGITAGTIAVDSTDSTTAIVGNHSNMTASSAYIDYVIAGTTISGATFLLNKKQTFTKVFPAASVSVSASSQIFSIAQSGTATPSAITFSATLQNTAQAINWDCVGGTLTDGANNTKVLQYTDMSQEQAVVTATAGNYADRITITKLREGIDSYAAFLSNETHTLQADSSGSVASFAAATTSMIIYKGTQLDTSNWTFHVSGVSIGTKYRDNDDNTDRDGTGTTNGVISAFPLKIVSLSQDEGYVDITATRTGQSITKRFTVAKARSGYDAKVYSILLSAPVIFKNSPTAAIDGVHTNITATGQVTIGNTASTFGYLTATYNGVQEAAAATANTITTDIANNSDITSITFKLYSTENKTQLLDSVTVPVIFRGATGASALNIVLTNPTHAIPCNESGAVQSYEGSGTDVFVYEGGTALSYDPNYDGSVNGTWKVTVNTTNIVKSTTQTDEGSFVRFGDHSGLSQGTASITYTATGKTSEGVAFSISSTQTFSKINYGVDARYIYIFTSAPVVFKDAASASLDGVHSNVTVKGRRVIGDTVADFGYVTYQTDKMTNESARAASHTTEIANDADITSITVRLYETNQSTAILDTEFIPVVFKGLKGSGAVNGVLSNATHAIPCSSDGTVLEDGYNNSGTSLYVYEGASRLVYDGQGTSNGTWKVDTTATGITVSTSVTDGGDFVTYGNHSNLTTELAVITYTVTGKTSEGISFTFTVDQTFVKARRGETIIEGYLTNTEYIFATDESGTVSSYAGTGVDISVYEGNTKLSYNGVGTSNGTWKSVASATNITASTSLTDLGTDVRYGVVDAITADSAYIDFTLTGKSTTGKAFTLVKRQNFTKRKQGVTGKKTATVQLYQWATAAPPTPTGNSTWTWSSLSNSGYVKVPNTSQNLDYWTISIPANPGTPGIKLWTATVRIEATNAAQTTAVDWTNAQISAISQNGQAGVHGATPTLFKWAATIPTAPTGTNTWTWADNDFDGVSTANTNAGWSKSPGAAVAGYTLWSAKVNISDSASNATTTVNWSLSSITAVSYGGQDAASYTVCYAVIPVATEITSSANIVKSGTAVPTAANSETSWGVSVAWSTTAPVIPANNRLWQSDGIYNPATNQTTWTTPYWSSLKVGSLSALSVNTGQLSVTGTISSANENFSVDENGNVVIKSSSGNNRLEIKNNQISVVYNGVVRVKIGEL